MQRPTVDTAATAADIENWYWTRAQLDTIAARFGVSRAGSKADVAARMRAFLAGEPLPTRNRKPRAAQLSGELTADTVVPTGQRMTRALREFMVDNVGPGFRFDAHMREFFADPQGRTLADAVEVWRATRGRKPDPPAQFEYNRFTRTYLAEHPQAARQDVLAAWERYKATPADQRGRA